MGSGKSYIGRQLAAQLGLGFVDLDSHIEKTAGKSIAQIFESEGESNFRELERTAFRQIMKLEQVIIATGGGTPCFFDNMKEMNNSGVTIYLEAPVAILAERLKKDTEKRPLIQHAENLENKIEALLSKRKAFYERAELFYHQRSAVQEIDDLVAYMKRFFD